MMFSNKEVAYGATTSCKNVVETVQRKNNLFSFKSLLVTAGLWYIILSSPSLPLKVVPASVEHGLALLATLIRGGGGIKSTRVDRPFKANYSTMSQVLLQLVVMVRRGVCFSSGFNFLTCFYQESTGMGYDVDKSYSKHDIFCLCAVSTVGRNSCSFKLKWVIKVNIAFCFPGNCISFTFSGHEL